MFVFFLFRIKSFFIIPAQILRANNEKKKNFRIHRKKNKIDGHGEFSDKKRVYSKKFLYAEKINISIVNNCKTLTTFDPLLFFIFCLFLRTVSCELSRGLQQCTVLVWRQSTRFPVSLMPERARARACRLPRGTYSACRATRNR